MNKNMKYYILAILFCLICLLLSMCSDDIAEGISGVDGKCDYCGGNTEIRKGTKEWCAECGIKYDIDYWH